MRCIRNWSEYNKSLICRGDITLWLEEPKRAEIKEKPKSPGRGRPFQYNQFLIESSLIIKQLFHLSFRCLEGFLSSLAKLTKMIAKVPNYSTLCRRQSSLNIKLSPSSKQGAIDLVVDSTGLKVYGEGEWCVKKHGKQYQRTWRKVHLAVDADTLEIVSCEMTHSRIQDSDVLEDLLSPIHSSLGRVMGDGAYDQFKCYETLHQRGAIAIFPPRRDARLSHETKWHKKSACTDAIKWRDKNIQEVRIKGRKQWKIDMGYHKRSLAETTMFRLKRILSDRLNARTPDSQQVEVMLRCHILNKLLSFAQLSRR
jgi:hypothetical protein